MHIWRFHCQSKLLQDPQQQERTQKTNKCTMLFLTNSTSSSKTGNRGCLDVVSMCVEGGCSSPLCSQRLVIGKIERLLTRVVGAGDGRILPFFHSFIAFMSTGQSSRHHSPLSSCSHLTSLDFQFILLQTLNPQFTQQLMGPLSSVVEKETR